MLSALLSPQRVHTRIVAVYLVLLLMGQALAYWLIQRGIEQHARDTVQQQLQTGERLLRRQLAPGPQATTPAALATTLTDLHALTGLDAALQVRQGEQPWRVVRGTLPATRWAAQQNDDNHLSLAVPLQADGPGLQRQVVLMQSLVPSRARHADMQQQLLALAGLMLLAFALVGLFNARTLLGPLRRLSRSARRLQHGDYRTEVPSDYHGELGALAESFETMRQAIQSREGEIRRLAFQDNLTGLPNREQFRHDLRQAIDRADQHGIACAVLLLDLDRFKHVNEQLGHRFGDRLLRAVADRLRQGTLQGRIATIARLGGDEFGVLLPQTDAKAAWPLAQRLLRDFETPLTLDGQTVDLGAGLGLAASPEHGLDADTLLNRAELAMYAAKQQRTGAVTYHAGLEQGKAMSLNLLSELRHAVDHGQLRLFLQPKVNLLSGEVVGAEALLRWDHPVRGVVPPLGFVPFAEQTGFVRLLTSWMLEEVARSARLLAAQGLPLKLAVNLSTRDLMDQELPAKLDKVIQRHQIQPASLVLEITESAIMDDPARALLTLQRLHAMGVRLSIDDFGTGYSSLAYLKSLPVHELKIDRSFVKAMESEAQDAKIVTATVELAHNLGLSVVAEGVENLPTWQLLAQLHCDEAQGHLIARPMPAEQFATWVRGWRAPTPPAQKAA